MLQHKGQLQPLKTKETFVSLNKTNEEMLFFIRASIASLHLEVESEGGVITILHLSLTAALHFIHQYTENHILRKVTLVVIDDY